MAVPAAPPQSVLDRITFRVNLHGRSKRILVATGLGLLVGAMSVAADFGLGRLGIRPAATFINNFVVGLVAAWYAYAWVSALEERHSRTALEEKIRHEATLRERARLAREIHDSLAQGFAAMIINLEMQQEFLYDRPEAKMIGDRALKIGRQSLADARIMLGELQPTTRISPNLRQSIEDALETLTGGTGLRTDCAIDLDAGHLPPEMQWELVRLVREAVHNVVKHAHAHELRVRLEAAEGQLRLCVEDDGRGFDPRNPRNGFGLAGMRERAKNAGGLCWVYTQPSHGTQVVAVIPRAPQ